VYPSPLLIPRLRSVVNNAGICTEAAHPQPVDQADEDAFDAHMRINARGVFLGSKYPVQQFLKQEPRANGMRGWVVNLASMVSTIGMPGLSECPRVEQLSLCRLIRRSRVYCVQGRCSSHDAHVRPRRREAGHRGQLHRPGL
jgi:NAD(P)-dependent dehydrogenase (short-subunit alcohol dehydrogenase family)